MSVALKAAFAEIDAVGADDWPLSVCVCVCVSVSFWLRFSALARCAAAGDSHRIANNRTLAASSMTRRSGRW